VPARDPVSHVTFNGAIASVKTGKLAREPRCGRGRAVKFRRRLPKRHAHLEQSAARPVPTATLIDTAELRVGMFVHLDLGWMSHPFALSSFRIDDASQIATIRALGLARVRWSPAKARPSRQRH